MRLILVLLSFISLYSCATSFEDQCLETNGTYIIKGDQEMCSNDGKITYPSVVPYDDNYKQKGNR